MNKSQKLFFWAFLFCGLWTTVCGLWTPACYGQSESASFLTVKRVYLRADNVMPCTVTVVVRTNASAAMAGQQVTICTLRTIGDNTVVMSTPLVKAFDTIVMTVPTTNASGQATGTIITPFTGACTVIAICNGVTITENLCYPNASFELSGGLATDAANWTEGGGTHVRNNARASSGTWAERSSYVAAGTLATLSDTFPVTYGSVYNISGTIFNNYLSANNSSYYDLNNVVSDIQLQSPSPGAGVWESYYGTWGNVHYSYLRMRIVTVNSAVVTGSAWFDAVRVQRSPTVTWVYDTVTNPGFEGVDLTNNPFDWGLINGPTYSYVTGTDFHSGYRSLRCWRNAGVGAAEVGANRSYGSYDQGWMLKKRKGWFSFWYKALGGASTDARGLISVIPMDIACLEDGAAGRTDFTIPGEYYGDGLWHQGWLKFDYTSQGTVIYVQPCPRMWGTAIDVYLDDFSFCDTREGYIIPLGSTICETVPGDLCSVNVLMQNGGDSATKPNQKAELILSSYLSVIGNTQVVLPIYASMAYNTVSWVVTGSRDRRYDTYTVRIRDENNSVTYIQVYVLQPMMSNVFSCTQQILPQWETATISYSITNTGSAKIISCSATLTPNADVLVAGGQNLVQNASFEQGGSPPANWAFSGAWQTVSDTFRTGGRSIRVSAQAGGDTYAATPEGVSCNMPTTPGTSLYIEAYCKTQALGGNAGIRLIWWDKNGGFVADSGIVASTTAGSHQWEKISTGITTPAGAYMVSYRCQHSGTGTIWFDDVLVTNTSAVPVNPVLLSLDPGESYTFRWVVAGKNQVDSSPIGLNIYTANSETPSFTTYFQVYAPAVLPAPSGSLGASVSGGVAVIQNSKVYMAVVNDSDGYSVAVLKLNNGGTWLTMGKMPDLGRLKYLSGGVTYTIPVRGGASPYAAVGGNSATLRFNTTTVDVLGGTWNFTVSYNLVLNSDVISCSNSAVCGSGPRTVLQFFGPVIYAGDGRFGGYQTEGLFPSVEWLIEGERSSGTMDARNINDNESERWAPRWQDLTIPIMLIREHDNLIGLIWQNKAQCFPPAISNTNTIVCGKFATPNFLENRDNSLMALFIPSVPEYVSRNEKEGAWTGISVPANNALNIQSKILMMADIATVIDGVDRWSSEYGFPDTQPMTGLYATYEQAMQFMSTSYTSYLWDTTTLGWTYQSGKTPSRNPFQMLLLYIRAMSTSSPTEKAGIMSQFNRARTKIDENTFWGLTGAFHFGHLEQSVQQSEDYISGGRAGQWADGGWRVSWPDGDKHWQLNWPGHESVIGTNTGNLANLFFYTRVLDNTLGKAWALKGLEFIDGNFGPGTPDPVPRGAQVWEIPQHSADGLASGQACQAYLDAYLLTGTAAYLTKAVYWMKTFMPFEHVWYPTARISRFRYFHDPIMGATWFSGCWWGMPVQWCAMDAISRAYYIKDYDNSYPWKKIFQGVNIGGMEMMKTINDATNIYGMYPDGWNPLWDAQGYFADLEPSLIWAMAYQESSGIEVRFPRTVFVNTGTQTIHVTSGSRITSAGFVGDTLAITATWIAGDTGFFLITGLAQPVSVLKGGSALSVTTNLDTVAEGWKYDGGRSYTYVKINHNVPSVTVNILGSQVFVEKIDPYTSDIRINDPAIPADGATVCTVTITCRNQVGNVLEGRKVTLYTSRGSAFDTLVYVYGQTTDAFGQVTARITSSFSGDDTLTAEYDGDINTPSNVLPNVSFESGSASPDSWSFRTVSGTWSWAGDDRHSGAYSIKHATALTGDNYAEAKWGPASSDTSYYILPSTRFLVSAWIRTANAGCNASLRSVFKSDTVTVLDVKSGAVTGVNPWTYTYAYVKAPYNANYFLFRLQSDGTGTVWFDDAQALIIPPITANYVNNASFEKGAFDYWASAANSGTGVWTKTTDDKFRGVYSARHDNAGAGGDDYIEQNFGYGDLLTVYPGEKYYAEQRIKTNLTAGGSRIRVIWFYNGTVVGEDIPFSLYGVNPWTLANYTFTVPSGVNQLMLRGSAPGTGTTWFDAMILRRVPTLRFLANQIDIITPSFTRSVNSISQPVFFIVKEKSTGNTDYQCNEQFYATSSSDSAYFWTGSYWSKKPAPIQMTAGVGVFNYRDGQVGNPVISVFRDGFISDTLAVSILAQSTNETASYMNFNSANIIADGISACTVVVIINDTYGYPIAGRSVLLTVTRVNSDAVAPATAVISDTNGQSTFTIRSTFLGWDTVTARCDGKIIRRGVNMENAVGIYHFDTDSLDYSSYNNSGTMVNGASFNDGKIGNGLLLNGTGARVVLGKQPSFAAGLTVEAWVKCDNQAGYQSVFNNNQFFMRKDAPLEANIVTAFVRLSNGTVEPRASSGVVADTGVWKHYAASWDGTYLKIYANGSFIGQQNRNSAIYDTPVTAQIGCGEGGAVDADPWSGVLDEVRIYSRVLTDTEVSNDYSGKTMICFFGSPSKVKITSSPKTVSINVAGGPVLVEVQDTAGNKVPTFTNTVTLSCTRTTLSFSVDPVVWVNTTTILVTNGAGSFYFKDTVIETALITVSRAGLRPDSQVENIITPIPSETLSYVRLDQSVKGRAIANGATPCTVTVMVYDIGGNALSGRVVTLMTNRGTPFDTIVPNTRTLQATGICTFVIYSAYGGDETITALCDGVTIAENILNNPSFEQGGSPPTYWAFGTNSGLWSVETVDAYDLNRSIKHTTGSGSDNYAEAGWTGTPYGNQWPILNSTVFAAKGYFKTDNLTGDNAKIRIIWWNLGGVVGEVSPITINGTNPWTALSASFTSPAVVDGLMCRCQQSGVGTAWFDAVRLQRYPMMSWIGAEKMRIITPVRSVISGVISESISIRALWNNDSPANGYSGSVTFSSSSSGGMFSLTQAMAGPWSKNLTAKMVNGETRVYYRDTKTGSPTITVTCADLANTSQVESINTGTFSATASFIAVLSSWAVPSDGLNTITVEVFVTDRFRNPLSGKKVTIYTSRGSGTDTIVQPSALTDAMGKATGYVNSSVGGYDTITARISGDPNTITYNFYRRRPMGMWDFNENQGGTASAYGWGLEGTIVGGTWVPGKYDSCISLNSDNTESVAIPDTTVIEIADSFTMEAWAQYIVNSNTTSYPTIMYKETSFMLRKDKQSEGDAFSSFIFIGGSGGWEPRINSGIVPDSGVWYHLAVTYDANAGAGNLKIYANGTLANQVTRTGTIDINANYMYIGAGNGYWNGLIDDVRVYNILLTPDELARYFSAKQRSIYFSPNTTRFVITTAPRITDNDIPSDSIAVEARDNGSQKNVMDNNTVTLLSSSVSGKFSIDRFNWQDTSIINLSMGSAVFYYKDPTPGSYTVSVVRSGVQAGTQTMIVNLSVTAETTSYIRLADPAYVLTPANASSACTVNIYIKDVYSRVRPGRQVTLYSSRGASVDSVTLVNTISDANGVCTGTVKSGFVGDDTITARCDGVTITENILNNPSMETGAGMPFDWTFQALSGSWAWAPAGYSGLRSVSQNCLTVNDNFAQAGWYETPFNDRYPVTPGIPYLYSFYANTDDTSSIAAIRMIWWQDAAYVSQAYYDTLSGNTDWTLLDSVVTTPLNANQVMFRYMHAGTGTARFDAGRIKRIPTISFIGARFDISTPPRTAGAGAASDSIAAGLWGSYGGQDSLFSSTATLLTTSGTGKFSLSSTIWQDVTYITFSFGTGIFYFRDTVVGNPVITITRAGFLPDTQTVTVTLPVISETASYISFNTFTVQADGSAPCTVTVFVKSIIGTEIVGRQVTVYSSRGSSYTSITYPYGQITDSNGTCTALLLSSRPGDDTITAVCDGYTITNLFGDVFDDMDGTNGSKRWSPAAGWAVQGGQYDGSYTTESEITGKSAANFTLIADYTYVDTSGADNWSGVYVRLQPGVYYNVYYRQDGWYAIFKNPSERQGANGPPATQTRRLKIDVNGTNFIAYMDGTQYLNWTDNEDTANLSGGFKLSQWFTRGRWDNLRIYPATVTFTGPDTLVFLTPPRTFGAGTASDSILVSARWPDGSEATTFNETCTFTSDSPLGRFSAVQSARLWSPVLSLKMVNGETYVYYKDTMMGSPSVSVRTELIGNTSQVQSVTSTLIVAETTSYLRVNTSTIPADGLAVSTANVFVKDIYGNPLAGNQVTVLTSRGSIVDTIIYIGGNISDENGICTVAISSSTAGGDTVTAQCNGVTIAENILNNGSFENGAGTNDPSPWAFNTFSGAWTWTDSWVYSGGMSIVHTTGSAADNYAEANWQGTPYASRWVVSGNDAFYAEQWAKTDNEGSEGAWIRIIWFQDGAVLSESRPDSLTGTVNWKKLQGTVTAPASANGLMYRCWNYGAGTAWFDSVRLKRTPTLTFTSTTPVATQIVITTPQFRIRAGDVSTQIKAVAEDAGGDTDLTFNNTVSLTTASNSGYFSVSNVLWANTSSITFSSGVGTFYYRDYAVGFPVLTADHWPLTTGTQAETISITSLQITNTPGFTITSVSTAPIMVRARDGLGNTAVNFTDSVALSSSSLKGKFSLSGTLWSDTTSVYFSVGSVVIFYKDKTGGNPIVTVSRTDSWPFQDTQQETVSKPVVSTSKAQMNIRSGETGSMPMKFWKTDTVEYTIYIQNTGTETATGNIVVDTRSFDTAVNNAVDYIYMDTAGYADTWAYTTDPSFGAWTTGNPVSGASNIKGLRWQINSLGINASKAIRFRVRVK